MCAKAQICSVKATYKCLDEESGCQAGVGRHRFCYEMERGQTVRVNWGYPMAYKDDAVMALQLPEGSVAVTQYSSAVPREFNGLAAEHPGGIYWRLKRPIGFALGIGLGMAVLPVVALIAVTLAYQGGPILIKRKRLGLHGKSFDSYYFRTLRPDSLRALAQDDCSEIRTDSFCRFLIRRRLDRIPLLWNVLRGDMNVVGPRPMSVEELFGSGRAARHTLSVRPGVTGFWWIAGESDLRRRLALDRSYLDCANPFVDLKLLIRTIVLIHSGNRLREKDVIEKNF